MELSAVTPIILYEIYKVLVTVYVLVKKNCTQLREYG